MFLLVFSLIDANSLESIVTKWYPEVKLHVPNAKLILVGAKRDLRKTIFHASEKPKKQLVQTADAEQVAKKIGALCYFETSSMDLDVDDPIACALGVTHESTPAPVQKKKQCHLQ